MTNATRGSKATKKRAPKRDGSSLVVETKRAALEAHGKQLAALERLIRRRLATIVESFYYVGVTRREILEKWIYAANRQARLAGYLAATKLVSLTQAERLVALVRKVLRGEATLAGQKRAYAPIALAGATPEPDIAAVDKGLCAWLKPDALRPETAWVAGRAVHATLKSEQVDALLARKG